MFLKLAASPLIKDTKVHIRFCGENNVRCLAHQGKWSKLIIFPSMY